jgi:hypothetical protein
VSHVLNTDSALCPLSHRRKAALNSKQAGSCIAGGYAAAVIANRNKLIHTGILAGIVAAIGILSLI